MRPVVTIVGPTGVGKTSLSLAVAAAYRAEIISGDALQFYRGFDIGTAKLPVGERRGIVHHLMDFLDPEAPFSVAEYQKTVRAAIADLQQLDVLPVLVGGSGLYLQSVLYDYRFSGTGRDRSDDPVTAALGTAELYERLKVLNPALAEKAEPENRRRILRMIDIACTATTAIDLESGKNPFYDHFIVIGLDMPRDLLYQRIEQRVDQMMAAGLLAEVAGLHARGIRGQAAAAIGYKELYRHLDGEISLDQAIAAIKQHSRNYAKRQLTWFRNQMEATWFTVDPDHFETTVAAVIRFLETRLDAPQTGRK